MDKSVQRVQNKLASMLDRLELEIQSVEKRIGDKLHILDRDKVCCIACLSVLDVVCKGRAMQQTLSPPGLKRCQSDRPYVQRTGRVLVGGSAVGGETFVALARSLAPFGGVCHF